MISDKVKKNTFDDVDDVNKDSTEEVDDNDIIKDGPR